MPYAQAIKSRTNFILKKSEEHKTTEPEKNRSENKHGLQSVDWVHKFITSNKKEFKW